MEDGLQVAPQAGILENQVSQSAPVKFTILGEYTGAKPLAHRCKPRCARRDHCTRRCVGIDDRNAKFHESPGNGAFSAGNAAGEPDAQAALHG